MTGAKLKVSVVKFAAGTSTRHYDAERVIEAIHTGGKNLRFSVPLIRIRFRKTLERHADHTSAKKAIEPLKKKLPGVMWSGTFSSREKPVAEKLIAPSGLLCADLDSFGHDLQIVREKLKPSPHLLALFLSPTAMV